MSHKARFALGGLLVFILAGLVGCSIFRRNSDSSLYQASGESGEVRKTWSGLSFFGQVTVEGEPAASLIALGFDSERAWSDFDDWEPAVGADPNAPYVYQLTTRYDGPRPCKICPLPAIVFRRSTDGGATWEPERFLVETKKSQNDPQIEVSNDGAIYAVILNDYRPGVKFLKSTDHGGTWSRPIVISPPGTNPAWSDRPVLAISSDGRDVYIGFNASASYVAASHDYGLSFLPPARTSKDRRYWFHNGGAVAPDGDVYFSVVDFSQSYAGDSFVDVLKSTDSGISWTTTRVDTSSEMPDCEWSPGCYLGFFGPLASLAADRDGTILLAYNAGDVPGAPQQLYVRTSPDGIDWSPRRMVSVPDPAVNNAFPAVAAGFEPGDFRLVWQDDRNGSTDSWNTWYSSTTDGGETWSEPVRLSDLDSGAPYKHPGGYLFPYGDYLEIAVDGNGTNHVIWGEGMSYIGPGGTWYTRGQ